MSSFFDEYALVAGGDYGQPLFKRMPMGFDKYAEISSGVYNDGILTVCGDKNFSEKTICSWDFLVGEGAIPIALLSWGDFICASFKDKVFYLVLCQECDVVPIGNTLESVFDMNLSNKEFIKELMLKDKFVEVSRRCGSLAYGECYIHQPWEMYGGKGDVQGYEVGDAAIYIDMVANAWKQKNRREPNNGTRTN